MMRADDYTIRRQHLAELTDDELKERFWQLAGEITDPLVELAATHTSPSIERSVLLRMGFSGQEAGEIVTRCGEKGLLGKGAGHAVLRYARLTGQDVRLAGLALAQGEGWDELQAAFGKGGW